MSLLKKKSTKKKRGAFIGTYIKEDMSSFLSLYCTANDITKTSVFKDALAKEVKRIQEEFTEEDLKEMVLRLCKMAKSDSNNLEEFYPALENELIEKKGLSEELVSELVTKLKHDGKKKKKKRKSRKSD